MRAVEKASTSRVMLYIRIISPVKKPKYTAISHSLRIKGAKNEDYSACE
jgi:hypothetical protein